MRHKNRVYCVLSIVFDTDNDDMRISSTAGCRDLTEPGETARPVEKRYKSQTMLSAIIIGYQQCY